MPFAKGHVPATYVDMAGQRHGMLLVEHRVFESVKRGAKWSCRCDCGNVVVVAGTALRDGQYCCGCVALGRRTHNMSRTRTYRIWMTMRARCNNPKDQAYADYGGRGIKVCDRWSHSFENFFADMGAVPPKGSIERKDNEGGYSPDNCCWLPRNKQSLNRRNNIYLNVGGERVTAKEASRRLGVKYTTLLARLSAGRPLISVQEIAA